MKKYQPTIGLEIHTELKTDSKMFCACSNEPEPKEPNLNICPVCTGQPGSLPVINQKAVEMVLKTGLALNCQISQFSKFDRKSYFYPDLPKNYQISQYDLPLCKGGWLELKITDFHGIATPAQIFASQKLGLARNDEIKKIRLTRIHLEEDTGKLTHPAGADYSLIDFNRAGLPLMELVTEPDFNSGIQARRFCEELQMILRYLDVSKADMEKGQMRCEVNISLSASKKLGTKVEIKNLNSFRAVERAIDYEINRQTDLLESGEKIVQETRGWDENKQRTFSQRTKEEAHDYRYFPEPDLPPLTIDSEKIEAIKNSLPELPVSRRQRFIKEYQLPEADVITLVNNKPLADYFESAASELKSWLMEKSDLEFLPMIKLTTNYLLTELQKLLVLNKKEISQTKITPENFAEFITLIGQKIVSSSGGQALLKEMFETGADPSDVIEAKDLKQISDQDELSQIIEKVIRANPKPVKDYQSGEQNALQFLLGLVMKESRGKADPEMTKELFKNKLKR